MSVAPERQAEILEEVVKEALARHKEWLLSIIPPRGVGLGNLKLAKPQARLQHYMSHTLPEDMPVILGVDNYYQAYRAGEWPPLQAERLYNQWQQMQMQMQQMSEQTGAAPPEMPEPPPMLWPLCLRQPRYVWDAIVGDFRTLLREARRGG